MIPMKALVVPVVVVGFGSETHSDASLIVAVSQPAAGTQENPRRSEECGNKRYLESSGGD
jgi:hypothetical protein